MTAQETSTEIRAREAAKRRAANKEPEWDPNRASSRFLSAMLWIGIIGALFVAGQWLRFGYLFSQKELINSGTASLYQEVLGENKGASPFGRLQFEHGKLAALKQKGLNPLNVLAELSKPAPQGLRVQELVLGEKSGSITGVLVPGPRAFDKFLLQLKKSEDYEFTVTRREEAFDGVYFTLSVEVH